jgi:hypothetical protein
MVQVVSFILISQMPTEILLLILIKPLIRLAHLPNLRPVRCRPLKIGCLFQYRQVKKIMDITNQSINFEFI